MIWGIQNFKTEYQESIINKQSAQQSSTQETLNLYSITNAKDKILAIYKKYTELRLPIETDCLRYKYVISKIQNLTDKYTVIEPVDIWISIDFFFK